MKEQAVEDRSDSSTQVHLPRIALLLLGVLVALLAMGLTHIFQDNDKDL